MVVGGYIRHTRSVLARGGYDGCMKNSYGQMNMSNYCVGVYGVKNGQLMPTQWESVKV